MRLLFQTGQSHSDAIVHIQPLVDELAGEVVELKPDQLEKYIKVGGHVRIIDGRCGGVCVGYVGCVKVAVWFCFRRALEDKRESTTR